MTRTNRTVLALAIACAMLPAVAGATNAKCKLNGSGIDNCFALWAKASRIPAIAQAYGLTVVEQVDAQNPEIVLVEGPSSLPPETTRDLVAADPDTLGFEPVVLASVTEAVLGSLADGTTAVVNSLTLSGTYSGPETAHFSTPLWEGYMGQPAAALMRLAQTHALAHGEAQGLGIVAIIDTGVDPDHPVLQGALVPGYDFLLDQAGIASEWNALDPSTRGQTQQDFEAYADQSFTGVVEGGGSTAVVNTATKAIVDQSFTGVVEAEPLPSAFGHGTMVAGLVRMVAPSAQIMPIRVFDGDGTASTFDIVKAVRWAVNHGANVINMSFSTPGRSQELAKAIKYARRSGVVCVSSAGNGSTKALTYPAAYAPVLGVAATDLADNLSAFSNHGPDLVSLAAPGEGLVTLYPGGLYAAGWGTSFSAALVSGATVLLNKQTPVTRYIRFWGADDAYQASSVVLGVELGYGRLDAYAAFGEGLKGY